MVSPQLGQPVLVRDRHRLVERADRRRQTFSIQAMSSSVGAALQGEGEEVGPLLTPSPPTMAAESAGRCALGQELDDHLLDAGE